ncbi:hypothetical protein GCM10007924_24500 [Sneathiella chinensis]|uniref:Uncharacterized protein n=1 Tax=Sneathiella chinensis TaxID=349750 RepID=A0ABQ5U5P5_9PROT|nr:hypothetical protein GCM10007924_24500 [Sneathiella chinensis]
MVPVLTRDFFTRAEFAIMPFVVPVIVPLLIMEPSATLDKKIAELIGGAKLLIIPSFWIQP